MSQSLTARAAEAPPRGLSRLLECKEASFIPRAAQDATEQLGITTSRAAPELSEDPWPCRASDACLHDQSASLGGRPEGLTGPDCLTQASPGKPEAVLSLTVKATPSRTGMGQRFEGRGARSACTVRLSHACARLTVTHDLKQLRGRWRNDEFDSTTAAFLCIRHTELQLGFPNSAPPGSSCFDSAVASGSAGLQASYTRQAQTPIYYTYITYIFLYINIYVCIYIYINRYWGYRQSSEVSVACTCHVDSSF